MLLKLKGKVYVKCVRSVMALCETRAMNEEQSARMEQAEMRMVHWMCGVSLRDRVWS